MKKRRTFLSLTGLSILTPMLLVALLFLGCDPNPSSSPAPPQSESPSPATVAMGGKIYDDWLRTTGAAAPEGNSPLWAAQTTNQRKGKDTWRCKECHGWDYKGKDGDYGSGSHATGFPGVYEAAKSQTSAELAATLKGSPNLNHDFSKYLNDDQISALVVFLKEGATIDVMQFIDYSTRKPNIADPTKGRETFDSICAECHGSDGKKLNTGSVERPEYVGTVSVDNPMEFIHKVRFGQPGAGMPAGVEHGWTIQNVLDVLAHAQTLPTS